MSTVCHIEIDSTNLDQSQAFYEGLFGWTFREFMGGTMRTFGIGADHIGGLMLVDAVRPGHSPAVYFDVTDLDAILVKVGELGGSVPTPPHEVPGVGFSAMLADPQGNRIGLVEFA